MTIQELQQRIQNSIMKGIILTTEKKNEKNIVLEINSKRGQEF